MADQCSKLILQVESAQQVGLLAWKELDQKIYITVFAPVAQNGAKNPQCFDGGPAAEVEDFVDRQRSRSSSSGLAISKASSFTPEALHRQPLRESVPTGSVTEQAKLSRGCPRRLRPTKRLQKSQHLSGLFGHGSPCGRGHGRFLRRQLESPVGENCRCSPPFECSRNGRARV